ncbi:MAG: hypothetical protein CM1200mP7_0600 [Chloroflexota bacterium]|nr:MAG: hypothetical protein CM1200mP7_0600 [Chloroflexota bacterium]
MSIIVNSQTKLLVQGITGKEGSFHAKKCKEYGTNLVAGAVPGRDGEIFDESVPIFDSFRMLLILLKQIRHLFLYLLI